MKFTITGQFLASVIEMAVLYSCGKLPVIILSRNYIIRSVLNGLRDTGDGHY